MKYNITKFQNGGDIAATFTPVINTPIAEVETSSSKSDGNSKRTITSLLDDKVFEDLLGKGLVNDVNGFVNEMIKLESVEDNPFLKSNNRGAALKLIGKINELKQNKELWTESVNTAKASGGLNEVAIDSSGLMYSKDTSGKVYQITAADYTKSKGKTRVLTVAELMNERQYNPQLIGQNSVFDVANNAIGLEKITDHIKSVIGSLGTETTSESKYYSKEQIGQKLASFAGKKPTQDEMTSLQKLYELAQTPGELYKVTSEHSTERRHTEQALNYIWKTLGQSAQQKLAATAALNGEESPKKFILDMLISQTDEKIITSTSPEKVPGAGSSTSGKEDLSSITPFEILHNGKTGDRPFLWNDPTTNKKMTLHATGVAPITTVDGKPLGMTTLGNVLKSEVGTLVRSGDAYFGDKKISMVDLNNIIYDGQDAVRVMMPINSDGSPNYNLLKQFNEVQQEVLQHKNDWAPERAKDEFAKRGFSNVEIGKDFIAKATTNIKPFLVMYGYTADKADVSDNNTQIHPLSSSEQDGVSESLKSVWTKEKVKSPAGMDWFTTYYKGAIAIPYRDDSPIYAASIAKHINAPTVSLSDARVKMETSKGTVVNGSSSLLE